MPQHIIIVRYENKIVFYILHSTLQMKGSIEQIANDDTKIIGLKDMMMRTNQEF